MPRFLSKIGLNSSAGDLAALTPETVLPVLDRLVLAGAELSEEQLAGVYSLLEQVAAQRPVNVGAVAPLLRFVKNYPLAGRKQALLPGLSVAVVREAQELESAEQLAQLRRALELIRFFLSDLSEAEEGVGLFEELVDELVGLAVRQSARFVSKLKQLEEMVAGRQQEGSAGLAFLAGELELLDELSETVSRLASFHFRRVEEDALYRLLQSLFAAGQRVVFDNPK